MLIKKKLLDHQFCTFGTWDTLCIEHNLFNMNFLFSLIMSKCIHVKLNISVCIVQYKQNEYVASYVA